MAVRYVLQRYPALGFPLYRRYWLASLASVGATQLINLGQGWLIYELTGSALHLGLLGAAAALPNIVMTLLGGVVADRFDRRRIMMATSSSIGSLLLVLAWLDMSGQVSVWHVLTIAALVSLITGIDWPARIALYPALIDRSAFLSAVALNSFIWQVTRMAMPALTRPSRLACCSHCIPVPTSGVPDQTAFCTVPWPPWVTAMSARGLTWCAGRKEAA